MTDSNRIPVTVLTGFLGSGKTTLLNRILTENHGQRIAVIENEFGEIGVDQELVINAEEEIFEMNNGCICCTVRGDLIRILGNLMSRRDKFDRIVLETTGLANPGPVAQTFFVDDAMRDKFALDGIVTLVDARHFDQQIVNSDETATQVAFADVIVLNKADLVSPADLDTLEQRVRGMNALARIVRSNPAERAAVPMKSVLGIGGFDLARALEYKPTFLEPEYPFEWAGAFELAAGDYTLALQEGPDPSIEVMFCEVVAGDELDPLKAAERVFTVFSTAAAPRAPGAAIAPSLKVQRLDLPDAGGCRFTVRIPKAGRYWLFTEHLPNEFALQLRGASGDARPLAEHDFDPGHSHDERVGSFSLESTRPVNAERFQAWLSNLLKTQGTRLYRMKGFLNFAGANDRIVIQGVHMVVDTTALGPWGERPRRTQLVFIGRELDREAISAGFEVCLE
ncbi:MAG: GTP-binding protein [Proteobacteria bacterium]|nr:GTP-binding protein [Pseudomonadota bacterium]